MKNYINIKSLYASETERDIEFLSGIYTDRNVLKRNIQELLSGHFKSDDISGKSILLKPNWVKHNVKETDELCLYTNNNFILAALEIIFSFNPKHVIIGDAPIQGAKWEKIVTNDFLEEINELSDKFSIPVLVKDFRRTIFIPKSNNPLSELHPIEEYLIFDVGKDSYLEPISSDNTNIFRVTDYDPDKLALTHKKGIHKYCITKELFNADVVISLPKVKTHQKAGITAALKNLVGVNGDKDFLPHHRIGGTGFGGDCYPGKNYLRYLSEITLDSANRRQGKPSYKFFRKTAALLWKISIPDRYDDLAAAWYGNDTTWRMVMDLNKIVTYGTPQGTLAEKPQRGLYSLCDGIIGGQGDGPLKPDPLSIGIISFSNNSYLNDVCMAKLMKLDIEKIPLLKNAMDFFSEVDSDILFNGRKVSLPALGQHSIKATPPPGWVGHI